MRRQARASAEAPAANFAAELISPMWAWQYLPSDPTASVELALEFPFIRERRHGKTELK